MTVLIFWRKETVNFWGVCSTIFQEGAEFFLLVMAMATVMAMAMVTATAMVIMANMDVMENIIHIIEGKRRNRAKRIVKI